MKNMIVVFTAVLLTNLSAVAQMTTMDLDKFDELKVFDRVNITLVKSTENKAIISGDDQQDVKISNKNGLLKIKMDADEFLAGHKTYIELHYTEALNLLDANEGAEITTDQLMENTFLDLKAQEGAKIAVTVSVRNLDIKAITGGVVRVSGSAPNQEAVLRSGGEYQAQDLIAKQSDVRVSVGGKAIINSIEYVKAKVTAGGSIEIYGNPDKVDEGKTLGGSIIIRQ